MSSTWFWMALLKMTLLLSVFWWIHGMASRLNPRWRVATWRLGAIGVATIWLLSGVTGWIQFEVPLAVGFTQLGRGPAESRTMEVSRAISEFARSTVPHGSLPAQDSPDGILPVATKEVSNRGMVPVPTNSRGTVSQSYAGSRDLALWCFALWIAGCLAFGLQWIVAYRQLRHVELRANDVPSALQLLAKELARDVGVPAGRVAVTCDLAAPSVSGLFKTTVLLPATLIESEQHSDTHADLQAALTHEFLHVRNHDLWWDAWMRVLCIVFWWHPLCWQMRAKHRLACEQLCDARSAMRLGREAYRSSLARLALAAYGLPEFGLTMAKSQVMQRLGYLQRVGVSEPLRWRGRIAAIGLMSNIVLLGLCVFVERGEAVVQAVPGDVEVPSGLAGVELETGSGEGDSKEITPIVAATIPPKRKAVRTDAKVEPNYPHTAVVSLNGKEVALHRMPPKPDYEFARQMRLGRDWKFRDGTQLRARLGRVGITHVSLVQQFRFEAGQPDFREKDFEQAKLSAEDQALLKQVREFQVNSEEYRRVRDQRLAEYVLEEQRPNYRRQFERLPQPRVLPCEWDIVRDVLTLSPGIIRIKCDVGFEKLEPGSYVFPIRIVSKKSRTRFMAPPHNGFGGGAIRFEIDEQLRITADAATYMSSGQHGRIAAPKFEVDGNVLHLDVELTVRDEPHSCLITLPAKYPNRRVLVPEPTNAVAMTFEQFLGGN